MKQEIGRKSMCLEFHSCKFEFPIETIFREREATLSWSIRAGTSPWPNCLRRRNSASFTWRGFSDAGSGFRSMRFSGVGGTVGSGKTALAQTLCRRMRDRFYIAVDTKDIYTREDAEFLIRKETLEPAHRERRNRRLPYTTIPQCFFPKITILAVSKTGRQSWIIFEKP